MTQILEEIGTRRRLVVPRWCSLRECCSTCPEGWDSRCYNFAHHVSGYFMEDPVDLLNSVLFLDRQDDDGLDAYYEPDPAGRISTRMRSAWSI